MSEVIHTWLIDDEPVFCETLARGLPLLSSHISLRCFPDCEDALATLRIRRQPPEVILLDISLPGIGGIRGIPELKKLAPSAKIIMLTVHKEKQVVIRSIREGAFGYIHKASGLSEIVSAITDAHRGERHVDQSSLTVLLEGIHSYTPSLQKSHLSDREKDVLGLVVAGLKRKDIAHRLGVKEDTIVTYMKRMYQKLDVHKISEAVRKAIEEGLI